MDQDTTIITERFNALPSAVRLYVVTDGLSNDVRAIARAFELDENASNNLENEIMLILLFVVPEDSLLENLISKVGIDPNIAEELLASIEEIIFAKLSTMVPVAAPIEQVAAKQQLSELADRFAGANTTSPQIPLSPVVPQTSVAAHIADMPIAQPRSSAQLDIMPPPIPDSHFQPVVAAPVQTQAATAQWATPPVPPLPPKDVQPVNTMGTDIERIHGYGAYRDQYPHLYGDEAKNKEAIRSVAQDALLKRAPVVETPDFSGPPNL